jgi:hypothetical protein
LYLADCTSQALEAIRQAEASPKRAGRHPEFVEAGKTAWRFLNCVTEIAKDGGLWSLPPTEALHGLLDQECGVSFSKN